MNRRDSLKAIALGSFGIGSLVGCNNRISDQEEIEIIKDWQLYGRTAEEIEYDSSLLSETFFSNHETETLSVIIDIIIPADEEFGGAKEADVLDFLEFIVKDKPEYQHPVRGGLMWLDNLSVKEFGKVFLEIDQEQRLVLIDRIAFPEKASQLDYPGVSFFTLIRNLTATGYFTSKIGIQYLGYQGNVANFWDGVPTEVLNEYNLEYDENILSRCVTLEERSKVMDWDDYVL